MFVSKGKRTPIWNVLTNEEKRMFSRYGFNEGRVNKMTAPHAVRFLYFEYMKKGKIYNEIKAMDERITNRK